MFNFRAYGQDDSTYNEQRKRLFDVNDIFHQALNSMKKGPVDTVKEKQLLKVKSVTPYQKYEGRIIRKIKITQYGFEKKFIDTSGRISYIGTRILNGLHVNTQEWVIKNNLFFREGFELDPYIIADNERYLRTLSYIQDTRIIVHPIKKSRDSVDIEVVTKDLFSITGIADASGFHRLKGRVADVNFLGMGQTMQFTTLFDQTRKPLLGYEFLYSKQNLQRSFIDATVAYSVINQGTNGEEEKAYYIKLDRPLISPYSHAAGGLTLSKNTAVNNYGVTDSAFFKYKYDIYDVWAGYNLGISKLMHDKVKARDRQFLGIRYFKDHYDIVPLQVGNRFDPIYNNKQAILGQITFFRQDYYKTHYIYGFGTTEDFPTGYKIAITGGWYKQLDLERPYVGIDANRYVATTKGDFVQYFFRAGAFKDQGKISDASILLGANAFGRLFVFNNGLKVRQNLKLSYARLWNQITYASLRIDNTLGLNDFHSDSLLGQQRISLYSETILFTKNKFFGFQFAPFVFVNLSGLTPANQDYTKTDLHSGLGGGVRTRNENLVFGTIEFKAVYFPRKVEGDAQFKITVNSDIRYKYRSTYVSEPDIIQLNSDNN
ncbi:MAG: hypothetical protein WCG87_11040 [Bacteroidota bacterium]